MTITILSVISLGRQGEDDDEDDTAGGRETEHLLSSRRNAERLMASIRQARATDKPWAVRKPDPDGKNADRASWAEDALTAFREVTGTDREDALVDLLCDLRHWCDREGTDFDRAVAWSGAHYQAETEPFEVAVEEDAP